MTPTDLLARGLMVPDLAMPKRLWTVTALMGNDDGTDLRPRHTATLPAFTMGEALQTTVAQLRAEGWAHEMGRYWWTVTEANDNLEGCKGRLQPYRVATTPQKRKAIA